MIHESILGTIGNTPIVRINRLAPKHVTMYVKCEAFNPMSSVKDRLAIAMIEDAERRGTLKPGQTVIEPTSGNTGIALAMVCAAKGYPFVAVMSDSFSVERRKLMKGLGYGRDYRYAHDEDEGYAAGENYFPDGMERPNWYRPTGRGLEQKIREKLEHLRALDGRARPGKPEPER